MEEDEGTGKVPQHPLNERIEAVEHELADLKKKLDNLEITLLVTRRIFAEHDIEDLRSILERWIGEELAHNSITPQIYQRVHDFLLEESARIKQAVATSSTPLDTGNQFRQKCVEYFKAQNLAAFRD
jgi:hypothetical protein